MHIFNIKRKGEINDDDDDDDDDELYILCKLIVQLTCDCRMIDRHGAILVVGSS